MRHTIRLLLALPCLLGACSAGIEPPRGFDVGASALVDSDHCDDPNEPAPACLFGEQFADLRADETLELTSETWLRSADGLTELTGEQLLHAVQQSSHTDVTTPAEALQRVDQQEIRRIDFHEIASERRFVVFEYGVGDNSYGAYFTLESAEVVASIHDGDVLNCEVFGG